MAARIVGPRGRVISFEADPEIAGRLRENLARNKFTHARVEQKAVWSESTTVTFERVDPNTSPDRGLGHVATSGTTPDSISIEAVSLDQYTASHPPPDFLKCDVEGAEVAVFQGAAQLLSGKRTILLVEMHSPENHRALLDKFARHGYRCGGLAQTHVLATPQCGVWPAPREAAQHVPTAGEETGDLGDARQAHEVQMQIRRVPWELHGWRESLRALQIQSEAWHDTWVLVQYTALAWSARGFPLKFPRVLHLLKSAGARLAVVFHDVEPFSSPRLIDHLRHRVQLRIMRRTLELADLAIFTVPPEKLSWLKTVPQNAAFIPVGPNLTLPETLAARTSGDLPTVGVFSITGGEPGTWETKQIVDAVQHASRGLGRVRLSVFGRHAELRKEVLRQSLQVFRLS
jgi:FkbM family methyltransferase